MNRRKFLSILGIGTLGIGVLSRKARVDHREIVYFDGSSDYMPSAPELQGNADAKTGTFSLWMRPNGSYVTRIHTSSVEGK